MFVWGGWGDSVLGIYHDSKPFRAFPLGTSRQAAKMCSGRDVYWHSTPLEVVTDIVPACICPRFLRRRHPVRLFHDIRGQFFPSDRSHCP